VIWLAAAAALVMVFLLLPVGVQVNYGETGTRIQACLGPIKLVLFPRTTKPKGKRTAAKSKKASISVKQKEKKKLSLNGADIFSIVRIAAEFLGGFRRKLRISELTIRAVFGGEDPALSALNYGKAWAMIGALTPILENSFRIEKRDLSAHWDPKVDGIALSLQFMVVIGLGPLLALAVRAGARAILILMNKKRRCKQ